MPYFKGFDFNEFEAVKYKKLPRLTTTRGVSISDWSFSGGIVPIWEDGKEGMSLKSTDDESQMEEFKDLVNEFNEDATQDDWDEFYESIKEDLSGYYKKKIKEYTEELAKLQSE